MLESKIESDSVKAAKLMGWWGIKFLPTHCAGLHDRIFIGHGKVVFIEYKRPGEKLRPIQVAIHKKFATYGIKSHICHSWDETKEVLDAYKPTTCECDHCRR